MHIFVRQLITEWRRLGLPMIDAVSVVAVSGGADSTALLLALADLKKRKKFGLEIVIAHFNHQIRGLDSDEDEAFVRELAKANELEFIARKGTLKGKSNLEQRARNARYEFLLNVAEKRKAGLVLTAHTMNDQAETVMMNIIRGTGLDGLHGIHVSRRLSGGSNVELVRPLLRWAKRSDTEAYCNSCGIEPRYDAMNEDETFTRVRIRRSVLPLLEQINPKIVESLVRLSESVDGGGPQFEAECAESLKISEIKDISGPELNSLIRSWIRSNRGSLRGLELKHIEAIGRLARSNKSGRMVELPGGEMVVKERGRLAFRHIKLEN